jgi:peptidoglycan/LPS O-acetylase OafA/YrhL
MSRPDAASVCLADPHRDYLDRTWFAELDGVRAVCMLLVITVHLFAHKAWWAWLAGARGVTVFFVLSGYLITTLALREEQRLGRLCLSAFYVRRACRLFPLYYLVLALYAVLFFALGLGTASQREAFAEALPWYAFYMQEVPFFRLLIVGQRDLPFFQSWSLGIEEKFYLLWPAVAFVLWRGRPTRRLRRTFKLTLLFAAVPVLMRLYDPSWKVAARNLHCYYPVLAGCLLAFLLHERIWFERLRRWVGRGWLVTALFLAVHFSGPWLADPLAADLVNVAYPVATAGLLAALLLGVGPAVAAMRSRPLVFVGQLSYGAYLLHLLATAAVYRALPWLGTGPAAWSVVAFALAALGSVAGAWVLRLLVEGPCTRLGQRWSRRLHEAAPGWGATPAGAVAR